MSAARGDGARARAVAADAARRLGDDERYVGKKLHALGAVFLTVERKCILIEAGCSRIRVQ